MVVGRTAAACYPTSGTSQGSGDVACFYCGGEIRCLTRRRYRGCILTSLSRIAGHPLERLGCPSEQESPILIRNFQ